MREEKKEGFEDGKAGESNGSGKKVSGGSNNRSGKGKSKNRGYRKPRPKQNSNQPSEPGSSQIASGLDDSSNSGGQISDASSARLNRNSDIHDGGAGNNDPSWYNKHAAIIGDVTNLPYAYASGIAWNIKRPDFTEEFRVPGIMTFTLTPAIGFQNDPNSALNAAANILYMKITGTKSGKAPFDAPDLMMYNLAAGQMYSFVGYVQRAYGLVKMYSMMNLYTPRALYEAMGLDYDAWTKDLANFRAAMNVQLTRLSIWPTATEYDYFKREFWKYSCVYTEGPSIKDQLYLYKPAGFYMYTEADPDVDYSSKLSVVKLPSGLLSPEDVVNYLKMMMDSLFSSGSMIQIAAWISSYYGGFSLNELNPFTDAIITVPLYRPEVLYQMKNATVFNYDLVYTDVTQNPTKGYIVTNPRFIPTTGDRKILTCWRSYIGNQVMESAMDNPTSDDNIINSRMKAILRQGETSSTFYINSFMEVVTGCDIYEMESPTLPCEVYPLTMYGSADDLFTVGDNNLATLARMSNFKYHPCVYVIEFTEDGDVIRAQRFFDVDNWTFISDTVLESINRAALYSLFDVPVLGSSVQVKPANRSTT